MKKGERSDASSGLWWEWWHGKHQAVHNAGGSQEGKCGGAAELSQPLRWGTSPLQCEICAGAGAGTQSPALPAGWELPKSQLMLSRGWGRGCRGSAQPTLCRTTAELNQSRLTYFIEQQVEKKTRRKGREGEREDQQCSPMGVNPWPLLRPEMLFLF